VFSRLTDQAFFRVKGRIIGVALGTGAINGRPIDLGERRASLEALDQVGISDETGDRTPPRSANPSVIRPIGTFRHPSQCWQSAFRGRSAGSAGNMPSPHQRLKRRAGEISRIAHDEKMREARSRPVRGSRIPPSVGSRRSPRNGACFVHRADLHPDPRRINFFEGWLQRPRRGKTGASFEPHRHISSVSAVSRLIEELGPADRDS